MKKILLASTALVASAGFAAADVTITGSAEMGISGGSAATTQFHQNVDVTFAMSGETDNGVSFGATVDLSEAPGLGALPAGHAGTSVWVKSDYGTLTLGDTDGALDWALTEVAMGGSIADDQTTHAGYNGNNAFDGTYDGQVLRYDNTFGDFGVALSAEIDDTGVGTAVWGLGVKYNANLGGIDLAVGLGYQKVGVSNALGLSLATTFDNGLSARVSYVNYNAKINDGDAVDSHVGIGIGYTMDALTLAANYGVWSGTAANTDHDGYALVANYDLGGGAVVQASYASSTRGAATASLAGAGSSDTWSLGLALSF